MSVSVVGLFLLKACGIRQQYLHEIGRRARCIDRAAESALHESGKIAGVIDVSVRVQQKLHVADVETERLDVRDDGSFALAKIMNDFGVSP